MRGKKFNRIKLVLVEKEVTNRELARLLEVREMTVSRWATNSQQPTLETLFKIAEILKVEVCYLLAKEVAVENEEPPAGEVEQV